MVDGTAGFLDLLPRSRKPRSSGLTHVLDKGSSPAELEVLLSRAGGAIDLWKMGWGTAYLEPDVPQKVSILSDHGVRACVGGTLLEVAWGQGRAEACLAWAAETGFPCVEVSNGSISMPLSEKRRLIAEASGTFVVVSEVGSKDPLAPVSSAGWVDEMVGDLEAGAVWVLAEGRESGTVGLYHPDGRVREDVADAIVEQVGSARAIFETPRKDQQAWFISRFGSEVNLGNVPPQEVFGLEALRLGLRADTIELSQETAKRAGSES
ncbi:MAG: phosphosulfolactate synthase [Actinomycetota bacterium]